MGAKAIVKVKQRTIFVINEVNRTGHAKFVLFHTTVVWGVRNDQAYHVFYLIISPLALSYSPSLPLMRAGRREHGSDELAPTLRGLQLQSGHGQVRNSRICFCRGGQRIGHGQVRNSRICCSQPECAGEEGKIVCYSFERVSDALNV